MRPPRNRILIIPFIAEGWVFTRRTGVVETKRAMLPERVNTGYREEGAACGDAKVNNANKKIVNYFFFYTNVKLINGFLLWKN